jgi:hypothetical protein
MAGLKTLAKELQSKGRNGDTILAHINPQEAGILKALGGSGTINPHTGLPEYFFKAVSRAVAAPFKAVNQVVKAIPGIGPAIDKGLVSLDKAIGNTIPGGWNTLAQTALAFTPLGLPAKVGLAALGGSGAFGPSGKFNLQRALMSGAMAYGMNQLTAGLQSAGGAGADATAGQIANNLGVEGASSAAGSQADLLAQQAAGFGDAGLKNIASSAGYNALPSSAANAAAQALAENAPNAGMFEAAPQAPLTFDKSLASSVPQSLQMPSLSSMGTGTMENLAAAGRGVTNLSGLGTGASAAASEFVKPVTTSGLTALALGATGTMSLDAQEKALNEQYQQGKVNQDEYNRQMEIIADGRRRAEDAMRANPYQFAMGGQVDDELGGDYSAMGMDQGNLQKGLFGMGYAAGGTPRFLSGGGDGMSDSIKATINDRQPARLADGEFVIPADVVSHLGNGSSKAGAKQLYSMMDRVRSARTGNKSQGKQINPRKYMTA